LWQEWREFGGNRGDPLREVIIYGAVVGTWSLVAGGAATDMERHL